MTILADIEKKFLTTFTDLLKSQKVQLFVVTHVGMLLVILIASKSGVSPDVISNLLFGVLASAGVNSAVVTQAHAKVDAAATSAAITAAKSTPIGTLLTDHLKTDLKDAVTEVEASVTSTTLPAGLEISTKPAV